MPFMSPYSASKVAVEALSDSLRRELKSHGVKVAVVEPGAIATPIWEKGQQDSLRTVNSFSKEMQEVYGPSLQRFTKRLEKIVHRAEPVALVVKAIEHALTSKHPRSRYPVGRGIGVLTALSGALPDTWMDRIVEMRR